MNFDTATLDFQLGADIIPSPRLPPLRRHGRKLDRMARVAITAMRGLGCRGSPRWKRKVTVKGRKYGRQNNTSTNNSTWTSGLRAPTARLRPKLKTKSVALEQTRYKEASRTMIANNRGSGVIRPVVTPYSRSRPAVCNSRTATRYKEASRTMTANNRGSGVIRPVVTPYSRSRPAVSNSRTATIKTWLDEVSRENVKLGDIHARPLYKSTTRRGGISEPLRSAVSLRRGDTGSLRRGASGSVRMAASDSLRGSQCSGANSNRRNDTPCRPTSVSTLHLCSAKQRNAQTMYQRRLQADNISSRYTVKGNVHSLQSGTSLKSLPRSKSRSKSNIYNPPANPDWRKTPDSEAPRAYAEPDNTHATNKQATYAAKSTTCDPPAGAKPADWSSNEWNGCAGGNMRQATNGWTGTGHVSGGWQLPLVASCHAPWCVDASRYPATNASQMWTAGHGWNAAANAGASRIHKKRLPKPPYKTGRKCQSTCHRWDSGNLSNNSRRHNAKRTRTKVKRKKRPDSSRQRTPRRGTHRGRAGEPRAAHGQAGTNRARAQYTSVNTDLGAMSDLPNEFLHRPERKPAGTFETIVGCIKGALTGKWGGNEKTTATKNNANNSNSEANGCYINSSQSAALFCADGRSKASKKEVANCPSQVGRLYSLQDSPVSLEAQRPSRIVVPRVAAKRLRTVPRPPNDSRKDGCCSSRGQLTGKAEKVGDSDESLHRKALSDIRKCWRKRQRKREALIRKKPISGDVLSFVIDERDAAASGENGFSLKTRRLRRRNASSRRVKPARRYRVSGYQCPLDCDGSPTCPLCTVKHYMNAQG